MAVQARHPVHVVAALRRLERRVNGLDVDASYHCWIQFYAPNLDWVTLDVSVADIYMGDFPLTEKNQKLVELTTAVGYRGVDQAMVDYYFGNLDERRVVWSIGRKPSTGWLSKRSSWESFSESFPESCEVSAAVFSRLCSGGA